MKKRSTLGRCVALRCCGPERQFGRPSIGGRCNENATEVKDGHRFCWVHARAWSNPGRAQKLEVMPNLDGTPPAELEP
jgi:hypothetical protein